MMIGVDSNVGAKNTLIKQYTGAVTTILLLASDGTAYATLALLIAAGKRPFPGLDAGGRAQSITVRTVAAGGVTDGSPILIAFDRDTAPADTDMHLVSGSGQTFTRPGIKLVWFRKPTAGDVAIFDALY